MNGLASVPVELPFGDQLARARPEGLGLGDCREASFADRCFCNSSVSCRPDDIYGSLEGARKLTIRGWSRVKLVELGQSGSGEFFDGLEGFADGLRRYQLCPFGRTSRTS